MPGFWSPPSTSSPAEATPARTACRVAPNGIRRQVSARSPTTGNSDRGWRCRQSRAPRRSASGAKRTNTVCVGNIGPPTWTRQAGGRPVEPPPFRHFTAWVGVGKVPSSGESREERRLNRHALDRSPRGQHSQNLAILRRFSGSLAGRTDLGNIKVGAARGTRTPDPRITNAMLYQLSYCGIPGPFRPAALILAESGRFKCGSGSHCERRLAFVRPAAARL